MNKKQLAILEKAFAADIYRTSNGLIQTKSKLAAGLVENGYLQRRELTLGGRFPVVMSGYQITHRGIYAYCVCTAAIFDIEAAEAEMRGENTSRGEK